MNTKKLIKTHMWYDIFVVDKKLLMISLKGEIKHNQARKVFLKIKDEK